MDLEDKDVLYESKDPKKSILFYTPFVEQKKDIDRPSTPYSIKAPFKLVHADIADIQFFSRSAVEPKYCLLAVDICTSKRYTYPMKSWHLLAQKNGTFLSRYSAEEVAGCKKLVSLCVLGGKVYAAEQKIREFKKFLFKSKKAHKATTSSRFIPKKMIRKTTANTNNIQSKNYGYPPDTIAEKAVRSEKLGDAYYFYRLLKVQKHAKRYRRADTKKDKSLRRRLREPLKVGKRVLPLAERSKKRTLQSIYISQLQRMFHFLTASNYLWSEKSLNLSNIIIYIEF